MPDEKIRLSTDALIAMIVTEAEERELSELPDIEAMNEAFHPSERFQRKMAALLRKADRRSAYKKAKATAKKLFIAMTVSVSVLFCCLLPAKAVREAVVTTIIEWHDKFVSVIFTSDGTQTEGSFPSISLGFMPDDFILTDSSLPNEDRYYTLFEGPNGAWLSIRALPVQDEQPTFLDNEFSSYYSIEFASHQGLWGIRADNANVLHWEDDGLSFKLSGSLDISEIIQIAENISITSE